MLKRDIAFELIEDNAVVVADVAQIGTGVEQGWLKIFFQPFNLSWFHLIVPEDALFIYYGFYTTLTALL